MQSTTEELHSSALLLEMLSTKKQVELFIEEERSVEKALSHASREISLAVDLVVRSLKKGGRLVYVGAGTSGRLGVLDASEIPPTFGYPSNRVIGLMAGGKKAVFKSQEGVEDDPSGALSELKKLKLSSSDVVCGIAASGRTPFVRGALTWARQNRIKTLLITCNPQREKIKVDVAIDLPTGSEIIAGSTRLKAGTATKCVLNMLTSIAMIQLGRVQSGRMTYLHASNQKLKNRAIQNVMHLAHVRESQARKALMQCHWVVAEAIQFLNSSSRIL